MRELIKSTNNINQLHEQRHKAGSSTSAVKNGQTSTHQSISAIRRGNDQTEGGISDQHDS